VSASSQKSSVASEPPAVSIAAPCATLRTKAQHLDARRVDEPLEMKISGVPFSGDQSSTSAPGTSGVW
jgi:hypothetical protein